MNQPHQTPSVATEATRRQWITSLGKGAAYVAPVTVLLLSSKKAVASP